MTLDVLWLVEIRGHGDITPDILVTSDLRGPRCDAGGFAAGVGLPAAGLRETCTGVRAAASRGGLRGGVVGKFLVLAAMVFIQPGFCVQGQPHPSTGVEGTLSHSCASPVFGLWVEGGNAPTKVDDPVSGAVGSASCRLPLLQGHPESGSGGLRTSLVRGSVFPGPGLLVAPRMRLSQGALVQREA